MAETNGKLTELRNLPEDLLRDKVNAPMLRPKVDFRLKPARADLNATIGGGHGCAVVNGGARAERSRSRFKIASPSTLILSARWITPSV